MEKISVVILQYNFSSFTKTCLDSVLENDGVDIGEILIVDNGSSPEHREPFINNPKVRLIEVPENLGYVKGTNVGWREAKCPYILHMNNDVSLAHNTIARMVMAMETSNRIGWVGASQQGGPWSNCVVQFPPDVLQRLDNSIGNDRELLNRFADTLPDEPQLKFEMATEVCTFLIRKEMSDDIGCFWDDLFENHQADYGLKMSDGAWSLVVCQNAIYWHNLSHPTLASVGLLGPERMRRRGEADVLMNQRWGNRWKTYLPK